jgi:hypothetical protein
MQLIPVFVQVVQFLLSKSVYWKYDHQSPPRMLFQNSSALNEV